MCRLCIASYALSTSRSSLLCCSNPCAWTRRLRPEQETEHRLDQVAEPGRLLWGKSR